MLAALDNCFGIVAHLQSIVDRQAQVSAVDNK